MKTVLKLGLGFLVVLAAGFWWLLLDGKAPNTGHQDFDLESYRQLASQKGEKPTVIHIETVGTDLAPSIAAQAGDFSGHLKLAYTSLQIVWPDKTIIIGGAVDRETATEMMISEDSAMFDAAAYDRMIRAMLTSDQVWITHEHLDHVMAIARHLDPVRLAPKLQLNAAQLAGLAIHAKDGKLHKDIASITAVNTTEPKLIAPGLVVHQTPGHSPGSQSFFIQLQSGEEYLLIGDIVWTMKNIPALKTRPRLLQYMLFDPNEDRNAVRAQIRDLNVIASANPNLIIIPSHDGAYLDELTAKGKLAAGFKNISE